MLRRTLKRLARFVAPRTFETLQAIRARRHSLQLQDEWGITALDRRFFTRFDYIVRHGPFAGMNLIPTRTSGSLISKALGSYEQELHPAIEQMTQRRYRVIADVGCAEGYFAIGLARRMPATSVYAFDLDPLARSVCRQAAEANGVADRVQVHGRCHWGFLRSILQPPCLVFSDCEGFEYVLLDPQQVPRLCESDMLVELHENGQAELTEDLIRRFRETHSVERYHATDRPPRAYSELDSFSEEDAAAAIREVRTAGQTWIFLRAKNW